MAFNMGLWKRRNILKLKDVVVGICIIGFVGFGIAGLIHKEKVTAKVTDKTRITEREGNGYYLIFTDEETFKDSDSLFYGKFNSSDLYGKIKIGKEYDFIVTGFRIPILSMYRNIVKYYERR